jgi:hypothetical protein
LLIKKRLPLLFRQPQELYRVTRKLPALGVAAALANKATLLID